MSMHALFQAVQAAGWFQQTQRYAHTLTIFYAM